MKGLVTWAMIKLLQDNGRGAIGCGKTKEEDTERDGIIS